MLKDVRIKLDDKDLTSDTEYITFALYIPKENREKQIKIFPLTDEWGIDLTTVRENTPLPTSCGYYSGRCFKIRKYVFCESKGEKYELCFTDSKRKFEKFVNSRTIEENNFLDSLKKK